MFTSLAINIRDILPADFIARVCANMEVTVEEAQLGWKSCDDAKKALPRRLQTEQDVTQAFDTLRPLITSNRRQKPVYMEIINLVSDTIVIEPLLTMQ
jgi:hypothetical protein